MQEKFFKNAALACAAFVFGLGFFYLIYWHSTSNIDPIHVGISYFGSLTFLFIAISLTSMLFPCRFPLSQVSGAILLGASILKAAQVIFFQPGSGAAPIFLPTNLSNLTAYAMIGSLFLIWRRETFSQKQYVYAFFVIFSSTAMVVLGLVGYLFGFTYVYGNTHLFGMIGLGIANLGLTSALIHFESNRQMNRYKWIPWTIGLFLFLFAIILSGGIYLNFRLPKEEKLTNLLVIYAFLGGIIFSIFASFLSYFWLLSRTQLKKAMAAEKELELTKKEALETIAAVEVGLWKWDLKKDRVQWDRVIARLFQINAPQLEGTGSVILERVHPDDRKILTDALEWVFEKKRASECTIRIVWPDGSTHFFAIKGDVIGNAEGALIISGTVWDITANKYSEQLLKLSEGVAKILGRAHSLQGAAVSILEIFHSLFGWQILAIWRRESIEEPFDCIVLENVPGIYPKNFMAATKQLQIDPLEPFFAMISRTLEPLAVEDLAKEGKYRRSAVAAQEGVKGSIAFPIFEDSFISGIVEFYKMEPFIGKMDPNIVNLLNGIGISIGEFLRRKSAEKAEQELAKIVTASQQPIYTCTLDGTILTWNKAAEKTFGWNAKEVLGKKIDILMSPDRLQEFEMLKKAFREGKDLIRLKTQRITKEGKSLWVEMTYSILPDEEGRKTRVTILVYDLTDEIAIQEALARAEEKYRSFVENIDEWIWEINAKGIFIYSNEAVAKVLGCSAKDVIGQSVYLFLNEQHKEAFKRELESSVYQKKGWEKRTFSWKSKKGAERLSESISFPILDSNSNLIGFRGAERDITEVRKMEQTKNEFISIVSHEIRSPLTSVHGALGLLSKQTDLPERSKELIQLAYRNSQLLAELVKDIIDIEKIELGKFEFHMSKVFLSQLVKEAIRSTELISGKAAVQIVEESLIADLEVKVDAERFNQALSNLLSNAINFSPPNGRVFVRIEQLGNQARVSIRDEGPGIPQEFESRIFGRFEQALAAPGTHKGTGLGLNIAKTIIEQMGGKIGYLSKPGQGATFYVEFPIENKAIA